MHYVMGALKPVPMRRTPSRYKDHGEIMDVAMLSAYGRREFGYRLKTGYTLSKMVAELLEQLVGPECVEFIRVGEYEVFRPASWFMIWAGEHLRFHLYVRDEDTVMAILLAFGSEHIKVEDLNTIQDDT